MCLAITPPKDDPSVELDDMCFVHPGKVHLVYGLSHPATSGCYVVDLVTNEVVLLPTIIHPKKEVR